MAKKTQGGRTASDILNQAAGGGGGEDSDCEMWTLNYKRVLPIVLQDWPTSGLLPAMFYLFRWGRRRGPGAFAQTFKPPQATEVARVLATRPEGWLRGFDGGVERETLADLLLACCVENKRRDPGRDGAKVAVHRLLPTHFFASWIDLPPRSQMRDVPEMLVSLLSRHEVAGTKPFPTRAGVSGNLLLRIFGDGIRTDPANVESLTSDGFQEESPIGLDQLLTVRIAQCCGSPPAPPGQASARTLPSLQPLAARAAQTLRDDLYALLTGYGVSAPRQSLLPMADACLGLGLTNLLLSTPRALSCWEETGRVPEAAAQGPLESLVDCSVGADRELRRLAEDSFDLLVRRAGRLPVHFAALRLLTCLFLKHPKAASEEKALAAQDDPTAWVNLLGDVAAGRHPLSERITERVGEYAAGVAAGLEQEGLCPTAVPLLRSAASPRPEREWLWRTAEGIVLVMEEEGLAPKSKLLTVLDNCLLTDEPNGWARSRQVRRQTVHGLRKGEARSMTFSNAALDFLVHRHLWNAGRMQPLSYAGFLRILRDQYGMHVHDAPPGFPVARELLLRNNDMLQRRLRDLGVLAGVNDAESMKRLRPRFEVAESP